jgi:hypothetical protein
MPSDLLVARQLAYEPNRLIMRNTVKEAESEEYGACTFDLNNRRIKFRVGKITPTKSGQFVTLWKRTGRGPIQPYDLSDSIDLFVVSVRQAERLGQFVFPKTVLAEKGIVSKEGKGGKRAMRIYPSWDITESRQAKTTQTWQLLYFFEIHSEKVETVRIQKLFFQ